MFMQISMLTKHCLMFTPSEINNIVENKSPAGWWLSHGQCIHIKGSNLQVGLQIHQNIAPLGQGLSKHTHVKVNNIRTFMSDCNVVTQIVIKPKYHLMKEIPYGHTICKQTNKWDFFYCSKPIRHSLLYKPFNEKNFHIDCVGGSK